MGKNLDPAEAVRILDDAFSGVVDVDFLGQSSKPFSNNRDPLDARTGKFCTMPVKLRFCDRDSRVYFENSLRASCGLRAIQSFPQVIRKEINGFADNIRKDNPGLIVMVRPDSRTLRINAFTKRDGEKVWNKYHASHPIPIGIMLGSYSSKPVETESAMDTASGGST